MSQATHDSSAIATGHVGLNVTNLERSTAFYSQALQLERLGGEREGENRYAFLGRQGKLVLTLWQQSDGRFDGRRPGLHHLSFEVADMTAVARAEARVRALGARLIYDGIVPHAEGRASGGIFFEDPDGTRLEVFAAAGAEGLAAPGHGPSCGFF
jgi:lactoylglutathione lyase